MERKVRILTDSAAGLPDGVAESYGIGVVPVHIQFGNQTYRDGVDLTREEFYRRLEGPILPTTSQPSPGDFVKAFREAASDGCSVISINVTGKASGTCQSARLARGAVPELDVEVFDSLSVSMGQGFLALEAAQAAREGKTKAEIIEMLSRMVERVSAFALISNIRFLQKSGRVHAGQALLANLLSIRPLIQVKDGVIEVMDRVRTHPAAVQRLIDLTAQATRGKIQRIAVIHGNVPEQAAAVAKMLRERFGGGHDVIVSDIGACLAVHGGPGILGVIACRA